MSMQFNPPSLIGATNATVNAGPNPFMDRLTAARAAGPIMAYEYKALKPKKQLKEIVKVLKPEKKTFLKIPYSFKYNYKDRCVICGTQKFWTADDTRRPPLPLHKVRKGYPMRGTYCEKHAAIHMQYEMLEQQILAEEHGLSFSAYIPSARSLNPVNLVKSGPITQLKQEDINSLTSLGWTVEPPVSENSSKEEQLYALMIQNTAMSAKIKSLLTEGVKIETQEGGE
tara:strand:- start:11636 stop:12316 length:681 start_codon:yes stop_codon:yes gene_type:complete